MQICLIQYNEVYPYFNGTHQSGQRAHVSLPRHDGHIRPPPFVFLGEGLCYSPPPTPHRQLGSGDEEVDDVLHPILALVLQEPNIPHDEPIDRIGPHRCTQRHRGQDGGVRIDLTDDEVVYIEQFGQLLHGKVVLYTSVTVRSLLSMESLIAVH